MSDDKPSVDPVPILLERGVRSPLDQSVAASLVGLVYVARQAFEEKRRKQCLEITEAILKIEPEHAEARTIQASVRSELVRDFANAQALAKDARSKNDRGLYVQAEGVLRRVVEADPDNLEAKALLLQTVSSGYFHPSTLDGLDGLDAVTADAPETMSSGWRAKLGAIVLSSFVVVAFVAVLALIKGTESQVSAKSQSNGDLLQQRDLPVASPAESPVESPLESNGAPIALASSLSAGDQRTVAVSLKSPAAETISTPLRIENSDRILRTVSPPLPAAVPPAPNAVPAMGALAVNASVPVEIYRGEEHLGSTPATLQFPAGQQTLEYRYQGLRQIVSHVIKSRETTTAVISFMIKVEINARPWAQVSVEGTQLRPLGQTPLGNVSVPIGSVLVFQNPKFPDKRYRVTAKDVAIQVTFP